MRIGPHQHRHWARPPIGSLPYDTDALRAPPCPATSPDAGDHEGRRFAPAAGARLGWAYRRCPRRCCDASRPIQIRSIEPRVGGEPGHHAVIEGHELATIAAAFLISVDLCAAGNPRLPPSPGFTIASDLYSEEIAR